jgi:hypothetical protein
MRCLNSFTTNKLKTIIWGLITSLIVICLFPKINSSYADVFRVWTTPALESIGLNDRPKKSNDINLMAARGEYEAFQIVIQAPQGNLENIDVVVSDLRGVNESVISQKNITLYREHYIYIDRPSPKNWKNNPTLGVGWYPDALIPFVNPDNGSDLTRAELDAVPFNLEPGKNQPIWVDVFVPRNTAPGEYQGTYTVSSNHGQSTGTISLTVWDFELPLQPSLHSSFAIWKDRGATANQEVVKHKLMPRKGLVPQEIPKLIEQWGLQSLGLPFWSGADYFSCKMSDAPTVAELKNAAAEYRSDLLRYVYVYSVDEVDKCPDLEQPIKQWGKNIHEAGDIKHLVVMKPKPELYDAIDIWVVQPQMYEEAKSEITEVMEQGDEVWFYTGHQDKNSPQWQVDSSPINFRIPQGFISQSLGLKGFLYARIDGWSDDPDDPKAWTTDPWYKAPVYTSEVKGREFPGEGMLVYPGKEVGISGVVPSIRLKWIRDGVEDYEYIEILKKLGLEEWALDASRSIGADWKNWTKNPEQLEAVRRKLGDKIQQSINQS